MNKPYFTNEYDLPWKKSSDVKMTSKFAECDLWVCRIRWNLECGSAQPSLFCSSIDGYFVILESWPQNWWSCFYQNLLSTHCIKLYFVVIPPHFLTIGSTQVPIYALQDVPLSLIVMDPCSGKCECVNYQANKTMELG